MSKADANDKPGSDELPGNSQEPSANPAAPGREAEEAGETLGSSSGREAEEAGETLSGDGDAVAVDLDELLADTKRERDEYLDLAKRARADFENFRKRAARETEDAERRGRADLAKRLVPAIDNLERALRAVGGDLEAIEAADSGEPVSREMSAHEALTAGIALVHKELLEGLTRGGVEVFDPRGERFDPARHEALSSKPAGEGEDPGVVVETLERGYRIGETLIRPARVVVTQ